MKKIVIYTFIVLGAILIFLGITNPSESKFLDRVGLDYGDIHQGTRVNNNLLLHLGSSTRKSYLIFSHYHYEFGNAGVEYFGIANLIFFKKSNYDPIESEKEENTISI